MKNISKVHVGVDVSKNKLDIYILEMKKHFVVPNNEDGLKELLKELSKHSVEQIVCESSGGYENFMLKTLAKKGFKTWQVEPRRIKAFIISEGIKAKTDAIDAHMIALFASSKKCPNAPLCTKFTIDEEKLNAFSTRREQLKKILIAEKSRLRKNLNDPCMKLIEQHVNFISNQIKKLDTDMKKIITANENLARKAAIIQSMPGMGPVSAHNLIAEIPELGKLGKKEIASLLGVAPITKQSGTYNGAAHIYGGRANPRRILYMASLSAVRHNPIMCEFYQRLINKGKKPKVALVAVMRKMIVTTNVMIRNDTMWMTA